MTAYHEDLSWLTIQNKFIYQKILKHKGKVSMVNDISEHLLISQFMLFDLFKRVFLMFRKLWQCRRKWQCCRIKIYAILQVIKPIFIQTT